MIPIFIATSAFGAQTVLARGQNYFVSIAAQGGASGVEIRGELFDRSHRALEDLKAEIQKHSLSAAYSIPIELWQPNGALNREELIRAGGEATALRSVFLKVSLGHYQPHRSDLSALSEMVNEYFAAENAPKLVVENDQTEYGGRLRPISQFLNQCKEKQIPVRMTFDIGNWHWTGENPLVCATELASQVVYIHCKKAIWQKEKWVTIPLGERDDEEWKQVLALLPNDVPRTIEFPIVGEDLPKMISEYIKMLGS